jgi:hypothetical protein
LLLISQVLFVGDGQDLVVDIDDEHREQLCRTCGHRPHED